MDITEKATRKGNIQLYFFLPGIEVEVKKGAKGGEIEYEKGVVVRCYYTRKIRRKEKNIYVVFFRSFQV